MTLFAYLAGSDVGNRIRLNALGLTNNADGSTGSGGIVFDDSDGTLTVRGFMKVVVKELACTSAPVLFSGYIGPRRYSRNQYRTGVQKFIDCDLIDENYVLTHRLITGADGKRPAETHNARITWLLASAYMSGLIADTSLIDTSNPRDMGAADYRGQKAMDVLNDIAQPIFRTFFLYNTQTTGTRGMFFDEPTAVVRTSTLTISNVLGDLSATCFAPSLDSVLTRDPSEVYSRIRYAYAKGVVIEDDATTVTDFFTDNSLGTRGLQVDNSRIGSEASARIMAQSLLGRDDQERDTITTTLLLPAASVGLVDAGSWISARFTEFPGYETAQFLRVVSRTVMQHENNQDHYDVSLVLDNHGLSGGGGGGAPPPGDFPHVASSVSIVQSSSGLSDRTFASPISAGNTLIYIGARRDAQISQGVGAALENYTLGPAGHTTNDPAALTPHYMAVFYKAATGAESQTLAVGTTGGSPGTKVGGSWLEVSGTVTPGTRIENTGVGDGTLQSTTAIVAATGALVLEGAIWGEGGGFDSAINAAGTAAYTAGSGWTEMADVHPNSGGEGAPAIFTGYHLGGGSISGSATPTALGVANIGYEWAMQVISFTGTAADSPPAPGQPVQNELASMAGAVGTLDFPYADGSLVIRVDGVLISSASITETDPAAGTFTLAWAPDADESVRVDYMGR